MSLDLMEFIIAGNKALMKHGPLHMCMHMPGR